MSSIPYFLCLVFDIYTNACRCRCLRDVCVMEKQRKGRSRQELTKGILHNFSLKIKMNNEDVYIREWMIEKNILCLGFLFFFLSIFPNNGDDDTVKHYCFFFILFEVFHLFQVNYVKICLNFEVSSIMHIFLENLFLAEKYV